MNTYTTQIAKLVHGGQGMGVLPDGRKVFVWNALPGETVTVQLTKSKKDYAEGFATEILVESAQRVAHLNSEDVALSTSPWKIMHEAYESEAKTDILKEAFLREQIELPEFKFVTAGDTATYRNKVEFSFWGDDEGLFYAHYLRATHRKIKLHYPYNDLIFASMSDMAKVILKELNDLKVRAADLKALIVRSETTGANAKTVAALFVKTKTFPKLKTHNMAVYYSNPKSPASVPTELLYVQGDTMLKDTVLGKILSYDVLSFFQVNIPVFEEAVKQISTHTRGLPKIDMYSGVGSIGIAVEQTETLVEVDPINAAMAAQNIGDRPIQVVQAPSEKALDYIRSDAALIVDPPRAGLHADVVHKILEVGPPKIAYLSCNPSTQARDVRLLTAVGYRLKFFEGYNFFPRTPHIESLVILEKKS